MARTTGSDGEKTEAAVREAAVSLIARLGYEAMSMRQLAAEVGVQAAALYRYFPTKEDLLFTLMREHMEGLLEAWNAARPAAVDPAAVDPAARLAAYVENHIAFHIARRHATHVSNMELRSLSHERLTQILKLRTAYEKELRAILRDGAEAGVFQIDDVGLTAMALIQMMTGVIVWFRPGERLSIAEVTTTYLSMTMRLVGAKIDAYSAARPLGRAKDAVAL
ncbi:TetR/AcrR family transcriptional regulator [Mesorhizobium sp.]|uniref:TetR/AcrR family transcriptional regulator n=1 Tax=Mesorhizobium sp. TaxID=1871066 RepID=UPI000FE3C9B7|nr:TetR/AcrR family transcriptional regulator [Mesorhizobium sp.]RWG85404.1 MAG: TetR/AcrR family transcriptional regulator [Mesorhizobium sp.]RWG86201.1 MAG: TetR/AcrR family transcriptional regulator [Mesorhizobium sp.]RWK08077.1 MAG: TetR/AcrR family transcriptional regulator [Mesorhizobium sp.]RWK16968.1 MAG: TetR/AcrR family transcriptional regulator [Mesorhizobium sp.]